VASSRVKPLKVISPLHRASRQLGIHLEQRTRELGLSGPEGHLLAYLAYYGPCTVREIRSVFGHKPSTLTSVLDRLEDERLIVRQPQPGDRRTFRVATTRKGMNLGKEARRAAEQFESEVLRRVRKQDLEGFTTVLQALTDVTGIELRKK
jgi:DNA-binding MarR family transcriptional regulator